MNRALASTIASLAVAFLLALALGGAAMAQSATVITDKADYAPGTIVTITGSGWQPSETVTLHFEESPLLDTHPDLFATADANGNIFNNQFSPDSHDVDITFTLTATGGTSGLQAQTTFTDAAPTLTITITGTGSVTSTRSSGTANISSCTGGACTFSNSGTPQATCSSGTCIVKWDANYTATLTAAAGGGFTFIGWSGAGGCTGTGTCAASANGNNDFAVTATFETAPTVTAVSPNQGSTTGSTSVTITGTNFIGTTAVKFASTNATSFTVNSATQITATSPAGTVGAVHITVTTPAGTSVTSANDQFTYTSPVVRRGQTIVATLIRKDRYAIALLE